MKPTFILLRRGCDSVTVWMKTGWTGQMSEAVLTTPSRNTAKEEETALDLITTPGDSFRFCSVPLSNLSPELLSQISAVAQLLP